MFRINDTAPQEKASPASSLIETARLWYKDFLKTLEAEEIDIHNPYALGMLSVLHNTDPVFSYGTRKDLQFALSHALQGCSFAFMETDEDGHYLKPQGDDEPAAEWILRNMKRVTGVTAAHMIRLYSAAKENRLILRKCDPTGMENISCKYIRVDTDGHCGITRNFIPLSGEETAGMLLAEGYGVEAVNRILARGDAIARKAAELKKLSDIALPDYQKTNSDYGFSESANDRRRAHMPLVQRAVCAVGKLEPQRMSDLGERTAISWKLEGALF